GYSAFELHGTGVGAEYFHTLQKAIGNENLTAMLTTFRTSVEEPAAGDEAKLEQLMRSEILTSPQFGPIARNIIQMWYVGNWNALPTAWYDTYYKTGTVLPTAVVSAQAYQEGLVWKAMESKPMGAKWPGFGTWGEPLNVQ
ncbi:MAG: hypothetical protein ACXVOI_01640, partial [Tumebacillaceae bacterium]